MILLGQPFSSVLTAGPQHNPRCLKTGSFSWYLEIISHTGMRHFVILLEFSFFPLKDERASCRVSQNVTHLLWTGRRAIWLLSDRFFFLLKLYIQKYSSHKRINRRQMPEIIVRFLSWTRLICSVFFYEKQKIQVMYSTEGLSQHLLWFSGCKRIKQSRNTFWEM